MNKIKAYFKSWNLTRIISFILGASVAAAYFSNHENSYLFLSVFLLAQSIFGVGCMGGSCATTTENSKQTIDTEEYKPNK